MKRIVISLLLLVACLAGSVIEMVCISNHVDKYMTVIRHIDGYMLHEDFQNAANECGKLNEEWTNTARGIDALLIHDYVDGIGLSLAQMKSHIETNNPDMYFAESEKTKKALASIKDSEYPYAENIL